MGMTRGEAICIAEEFQKELEDIAEKYGAREFLDISVQVDEGSEVKNETNCI